MHKVGIEPAEKVAAIAKRDALAIVSRPSPDTSDIVIYIHMCWIDKCSISRPLETQILNRIAF